MTRCLFLVLALLMTHATSTYISAASPAPAARLFRLDQVRLLDGPFQQAQETNRQHLLAHDVDRLLAPFRRDAGLPEKAQRYGNWESMGLDGHSAGHYLSALAMMHAATGDAELKRRMDYMVSELAECQKANGNGYVGGIPNGKALWTEIAAGNIRASGFDLNGRWVPWYNIHKLYAGLRDAHLIGRNGQAKDVLIGLADWCERLVANLSDAQMQRMLRSEHGGMNEVLADVSVITGDPKYLELAKRFNDRAILDPLAAGRDELTGKHANTQIPKVIGFERIAALAGEEPPHRAAEFFWEQVSAKRSVAIGGNSVDEHFHPADNFTRMMQERTGPETCNTYNMLRLSEALFQHDPQARYADFYERALYNHILSTQHPQRGGYVYFTPMRPRHYRVYSQAGQAFWCCVGSGFENHSKYGQFIYARGADDSLYVNLFIASELNAPELGMSLRQETKFPEEPNTRLTVTVQSPRTFALHIRKPFWAEKDAVRVRVNEQAQQAESGASGYLTISREWRGGDVVTIDLPMEMQADPLPDGSNYVALRYGPIVLAAATGTEDLRGLFAGSGRGDHIAHGSLLPLHEAPMLISDGLDRALQSIQPDPSAPLTFTAGELIQPRQYRNLKLIPFFRLHEARYVLYFRNFSPEQYARERQRIEQAEREQLRLDQITIDRVTPGAQQSEVDHNFRGERTNSGTNRERGWRDARGWFSYELKNSDSAPADLLVTYFGGDRGRRFTIRVNDQPITQVTLSGDRGDEFHTERYPLPAPADGTYTIRFDADEGSIAGGVYDIRVVRRE